MAQHYTWSQLESRYKNFQTPSVSIEVNGVELANRGIMVSDLSVDLTLDAASDASTFVVANAYDPIAQDFKWLDEIFVLGHSVKVKLGYVDRLTEVFFGVVSGVEAVLSADSAPELRIECMDFSWAMMSGSTYETWQEKSYTDVAKEVLKKYPLRAHVEHVSTTINQIVQDQKSDFDFMNELASILNYEFSVQGRSAHFKSKTGHEEPMLTLAWGKDLSSFRLRANVSAQLSAVTVRGSNEKEPSKPFIGTANKVNKLGTNSRTGPEWIKKIGTGSKRTRDEATNAQSVEEAKARAQAILDEAGMKLLSGQVQMLGLPEITPGRFVKITGVGKKFDQPYRIASVTHSFNSSQYHVTFKIEGNAL